MGAERIVSDSGCELRRKRAAKQHTCHLFGENGQSAGCTEFIDAGDLYIENMDEAPAYQSGTRYCMPCAIEHFGIAEAGEMSKSDGLGA